MTARDAYDLLARTPACTPRGVHRMLEQGQSVTELARRLARPQSPPPTEAFVTPACSGYPALLRELKDPPLRLFHQGQPLERLSPHCVAVVGSRQASSYGVSWARRLGATLARNGISVCSGLALGIDAAAHRGALEACLAAEPGCAVPVGVLGHGFAHIYPSGNRLLRHQMEERGVLLSEYVASHPPSRWTFPERNRIIAGMCQTVVIVEAGQRSGSLHTARFALESGRDVWVVPNRPGTLNSAGVLALLRDGASPMSDIEEFVGQLVCELRVTFPRAVAGSLPPHLIPLLVGLSQAGGGGLCQLCQSLEVRAEELALLLAEAEALGLARRALDGSWSLLAWDLLEQELQQVRERALGRAA